MNIYDQILNLCVSDDELRGNLSAPCRRNGKVMATNGHVLVLIEESLPEGLYGDNEYCEKCKAWHEPETKKIVGVKDKMCEHSTVKTNKFPKNADILFFDAIANAGLNGESKNFGLAELDSALAKHEKEPVYESKPCPNKNCDGGHVSCDCCGYDDTCWTCDGDGLVYTSKVIGQQFKYDAEVKIGEVFFKAFYANDVLAEIMRLTGSDAVLVAQQGYNKNGQLKYGSIFKIGNVDLMMMPVAKPDGRIGVQAKSAVVEFNDRGNTADRNKS